MAMARATVVLLRSEPAVRLVRLNAIGSSAVVTAVVTHAYTAEAQRAAPCARWRALSEISHRGSTAATGNVGRLS